MDERDIYPESDGAHVHPYVAFPHETILPSDLSAANAPSVDHTYTYPSSVGSFVHQKEELPHEVRLPSLDIATCEYHIGYSDELLKPL